MSVNSRNTNYLLNQQIQLLKQVSSNRNRSVAKSNLIVQDSSRQSKFYNSHNYPVIQHPSVIQSSNLNNPQMQLQLQQNIINTNQSQNQITSYAQVLQSNQGQALGRQNSLGKKRPEVQRKNDKIFLPQNINENSYRNDNQLNQSANHSHVPSNSGLYQQIRSKNNNSVLVQSQQNGLIQYSINNNNNAHQSQIQIKDYRASVDNVLSQNNNNNIIQQSNPGNGLNISQDSNRKSALIRYQQQFSSQKRSSIKAESSGKNSIKNNGGSKGDSFFSSRVNASMGASKDNLKQVIKIYKEGLRADGEVSNTNGYQSNRISQNAKDSNSKGSLISNVRNMSVPRAANQPSKFMISSQDYSGIAGNINNNNAYYSTDKTNVKDKGQLNRNEALNSSIGNMKLTDAYGLNETEDYSRSKFTETTPMTQNGVMNSNTKHHSILQGTLRHCNCPCNCQSNQQDTQSQTTNNHNMMSILSGNNKKNNYNINNTMTLRIGHALNTTTGHQTTTVMIDEPNVEATNIEDMHILLVNVEKIKRKMLGKTEGQLDPVIDYRAQLKYQQDIEEQNQQKGNNRDDFSIELHNTSGLNVIIYE